MTGADAQARRRGQPLWALAGVLLAWIGLRAALIELPPPRETLGPPSLAEPMRLAGREPERAGSPSEAVAPVGHSPSPYPLVQLTPPIHARWTAPLPPARPIAPYRADAVPGRAAGHNLLWMAAMGAIPLLPQVSERFERAPPGPATSPFQVAADRGGARWSGDAWLAWREGPRGLGRGGPATPAYGASQAGAVLRYHLRPSSPNGPYGYLRAVKALGEPEEGDAALGLAMRPLASLPVTAHGELRLTRRGEESLLRPAAFLTTGVEATPIGAGIAARGYLQAGYVGGREATAFADGSLVAERALWREGDAVLTAGAGAWGGAQRGAARLDIGPSASLRLRLGGGGARLSADYRLRVAGNAEPAAGAALTLSAGF